MQKIVVEIASKGYTGLTAENIEKALNHYFGSSDLKVSFSVSVAAEQRVQSDLRQHCGHHAKYLFRLGNGKLICGYCGASR